MVKIETLGRLTKTRRQSLTTARCLTACAVAVLVVGCNSRGTEITRGIAGTAKIVNDTEEDKIVGKGRTKRREALSREERLRKLRHLENQKRSEGE